MKLLLLSLFTQIEYQLPNMVMGILLRENIRQAVQVGISANQILQVRLPTCGGTLFRNVLRSPTCVCGGACVCACVCVCVVCRVSCVAQFLETNAHPQMKQNTPIIPESIADQLRLWEAEDRRLSLSPGYFYDDFASRTPYFVLFPPRTQPGTDVIIVGGVVMVQWRRSRRRKSTPGTWALSSTRTPPSDACS